jgi:hypothetical protein
MQIIDGSFNAFYLRNFGTAVSPAGTPGVLLSAAKLSVGTSSPSWCADIHLTSGANDGLRINQTTSTKQAFLMFSSLGSSKWLMGKQANDTFFMWDQVRARDFLEVDGTGNLLLQPSGGLVGIGTSSPSALLQVNGTTGITGGSVITGVNGIQSYFSSNAGTITATDPGNANRQLTLQGHPLIFQANGGEVGRCASGGNMIVGTSALASSATNGFLYLPVMSGLGSGSTPATPTIYTGSGIDSAPAFFDRSNNKLWVYNTATSAWKSVVLT